MSINFVPRRLTPRRLELLRFYRDYMRAGWGPPATRDAMRALNLRSTNAATELAHALVGLGLLEQQQHPHRTGQFRPTMRGVEVAETGELTTDSTDSTLPEPVAGDL